METRHLEADVLVIGGGTAGPIAAIKAKAKNPQLKVLLLDKANVKRAGAIAEGMDSVNNAIVPGFATPEQYVKEITIANDGIVNQAAINAYAVRSYAMIRELDEWGVKFEKDETGDYAVKKVHHLGAYVLPMPEGYDVKKVIFRQLRKHGVQVSNRLVTTRLLVGEGGRVAGAMALDSRSGEFVVIRAKAVVLCTGAAGRLGLPSSGYLFGTYENPTNAGDGYSMAYHAGAELSGLECFQINPLIKDYNGPACAYVTGPFGGYTVNAKGERFIKSDYWSGQMMLEFWRELEGGNGPVFLKLDHLADETVTRIENVLHITERPTRGRFHEGRGTDYRSDLVEMHISEIGLCGGHSASGVWVDEHARTTVPGLYAAGDLCNVAHNYMLGAMVYGQIAGEDAVDFIAGKDFAGFDEDQVALERQRVFAPLLRADGLPPTQVEYKLRRMVNDYLQPPKVTRKMEIGLQRFAEIRADLAQLKANNPHELMRAMEVYAILDCAELAAQASLYRTESRWGLYHYRVEYEGRNDAEWFAFVQVKKGADGRPHCFKRAVPAYLYPIDASERDAYDRLRFEEPATV
ncbi:fumarate reductase/succinate dehydrogenase flavoprotein subunit [Pseudothauera nasutitermitis]|uniref:Fumarate reductase/succinate dehydrogenase flavoprotein subunit n=1 Tax=Pseudothauera nasutitermitis TaxID=2565930 RepID=A0A4S4B463_9RHOO|nr:fumarate reductase/succinate dehydrogenase flavoprotein subunit [Pseudothauera nasutitermitis]THF67365.1 fumarate reductase/succinate dehydrogenase flavoprotein subunit [Pseudothauera nasutitermitis]